MGKFFASLVLLTTMFFVWPRLGVLTLISFAWKSKEFACTEQEGATLPRLYSKILYFVSKSMLGDFFGSLLEF